MKLSTARLKELISEWLSKPEIRKELSHDSDMSDPEHTIPDWENDDVPITQMARAARLWGCPHLKTPVELEEHIWNLWKDGSNWKRQEKRHLKDEAEDTFSTREYRGNDCNLVPDFPCDMLGEHDVDLVKRFFHDPASAQKCIYRLFVPNNQLADNYRLEVITTPEDDAVVGWWVTVD